jgi:hypothetical protein
LLYLDHLKARGVDLFSVCCDRDLEGVVGKWARGSYRTDGRATSWLKIKNRDYTQMVDRHELFANRHRHEGRGRSLPSRPDLVLCWPGRLLPVRGGDIARETPLVLSQ